MRTRSQTMNNEVSYLSTQVVFLHDQGVITRSKSDILRGGYSSHSTICNSYVIYPSRYSERLRRRNQMYDVDIDFDEASRAWLKNKTPVGNGCYIYTKNT